MQISLRVNTRDHEATARSAKLMERLGGIVAEPLSPTDEAAWVPLREAGRASDTILGLRINGSMLRQPFSLAWQLTRLQAATRKPIRLAIGVPGDATDEADAMFQLKAVTDLIDRNIAAGQPWLDASRVRAAYWPVPRDPITGAPPEVALYDGGLNESLVMAAAQAADWYIAGSASSRRLRAAASRLAEAVEHAHRSVGSVRLGASARMLVASTPDEFEERARGLLDPRLPVVDLQRWQTRAHREWIAGTPREIVRRLSGLHGAGVEWLLLSDGLEAEVMAGGLLASQLSMTFEAAVSKSAVPAS